MDQISIDEFNKIWNNIGKILTSNNNFDPDKLEKYLSSIGVRTQQTVQNEQHIHNINKIKTYLTHIGFLTDINKVEISETLAGLDHSNLYTITFDGKSLASEMELIPGDLFIQHDMWKKFLNCCTSQNAQEAFKECLREINSIAFARQTEPLRRKLTHFERLIKIVNDAKKAELAYRKQPNNLSLSVAYNKPNFSIIEIFINLIKEEKIQEAADWLNESANQNELKKGMFGSVLANKMEEVQPFGCETLAALQECLHHSVSVNNKVKF